MQQIAKTKLEEELEQKLDIVGFTLQERRYIHEIGMDSFLFHISYIRPIQREGCDYQTAKILEKVFGGRYLSDEQELPLILRITNKNSNNLFVEYQLKPAVEDYKLIRKITREEDYKRVVNELISKQRFALEYVEVMRIVDYKKNNYDVLVGLVIGKNNIVESFLEPNKYQDYFIDLIAKPLVADKLAKRIALFLRNH